MHAAPLSVSIKGRHVSLSGELDMSTRAIFDNEVALIPPGGPITIDLSELTFMDSTGIHAIVSLARRCADDVFLENPQGAVRKILDIAGVDERTGVHVRKTED